MPTPTVTCDDRPTEEEILAEMPILTRADGFLICLQAGAQRQYEYSDDWREALDLYLEPPMGWVAAGICACRNGIPFAPLNYFHVSELQAERRAA